jgi:hypothetical protein
VAKRLIPPIAGLVLLVVGLVAISGLLPRNSGQGTVATSTPRVAVLPTPPTSAPGASAALPTEGTTEPPIETPGVPTGNEGLIVDWREVADPGLGVVIGVKGAASSNGRVVVIGSSTQDYLPAIWTSGEGTTWQLADFPDAANNALTMTGLTSGGPGFVALGTDFESGAGVAYASTDGMSWQRANDTDLDGQGVYLMGAAGQRVVAFADSGAVFTSTDGLSWDPALDATAAEVGDGLLEVADYGGSLWAFSEATSANEDEFPPVDVWRTDDGVAWVRLGTVPESQGTFDARAAVGPRGMVLLLAVAPSDDVFAWVAWQSVDGTSWQRATYSPTEITDILADDGGFIAVGHNYPADGCAVDETENVGVTWTSVDGLKWRQMPAEEGWLGRWAEVLGLTGRTLVGVGIDWNLVYSDPNGDSGVAWTADLPAATQDDAPPPEPAPEPTPSGDCF